MFFLFFQKFQRLRLKLINKEEEAEEATSGPPPQPRCRTFDDFVLFVFQFHHRYERRESVYIRVK